MYDYFKNIAEKNSCQSAGVCSVHPSLNALYEILISEIKEISFYLVKLKEFGITNKIAMAESIEALSVFLINTSFNKEKYLNLIKRLNYLKIKTKEKYIEYTKAHEIPCEVINTKLIVDETTTISSLIKYAQSKQKNPDISKQRLFELISLTVRLCAVDIVKIKNLDNTFDEYDFEILRFFALTNSYSIRNEKIIRRIKEFSHISKNIKQKLYAIQEEIFGKKQNAFVNTSIFKGHNILVSGEDLNELKNLLETIQKLNPEKNINVYTNGALFMAHFFPYFKNNKYLKGHWGTDNAQYDFSVFSGSILITQNFTQKIDSLYKGEIFSSKIISFERVFDIKNNDYMPVIKTSLELDGFNQEKTNKSINVNYDDKNINEILENFSDNKIAIVTAKLDENKLIEVYDNIKIINLNFPIETDLLYKIIDKLSQNNIKINIFFSQCDLEALSTIFTLLNENVEMYLANCSSILISPHVIEALKLDFNIKTI